MSYKSNLKGVSPRWWEWALIVGGLPALALVLWLWLRRRTQEETTTGVRIEITQPPDDLRRIEGVGPKIASALQSAGVATFAQLAATDVAWLREILRAEGIRVANPATWPEQARLAAAGEWDALDALQAELKGGRRI